MIFSVDFAILKKNQIESFKCRWICIVFIFYSELEFHIVSHLLQYIEKSLIYLLLALNDCSNTKATSTRAHTHTHTNTLPMHNKQYTLQSIYHLHLYLLLFANCYYSTRANFLPFYVCCVWV